jgi:hypothetical protein
LHLTGIRNRTADGNVLLWQADVARFPGDTVFERAKEVGGICLTPQAAKEEIDGTDHPVEVFTPPLGGEKAPKARIVRKRPGKEERHEFGQRDRTGHIFAKGRRIHACHPV